MSKINYLEIKKRIIAVTLLIILCFLALSGRLIFIQLVKGESIETRAFGQWTRDLPFRADRGDILDRNGNVLVTSQASYTLYARPSEIKDKEGLASVISNTLDADFDKILEKISKKGVSELTVAKGITQEQMLELCRFELSGVYLTADSGRYYEYGNYLTQVLGFTNVDGEGQSGLELYYNQYFKGTDGYSYTQTDIIGRKLENGNTYFKSAIKGMNANLTIDSYMQSFAEKAVNDAVAKYSPKSASCIMMSANSGQILAMAVAPTYDLNNIPRDDMEKLLAESKITLVTDSYEPGSTFKILTSAIGMETSHIKNSYYCPGFAIVDGQRIKCWRSIGHGSQDFPLGIKNSCNCVFMDIAQSCGVQTMYDYFAKFGLGKTTGVDINGEASGIMLKKENVKTVDIARIGFGQAIAVTPIQLVTAVSSCINGGYLYRPYILDSFKAQDGTVGYRNNSLVVNKTISANTSATLKEYLYGVVDDGGGKNAKVEGYKIGGKTGTAQKYENGAIARGKYISSFLGFTDIGDDTIVCLMLVDEPQGYAYYGSIVAAPFVKDIFTNVFAYKGIAPIYTDADKQVKEMTMPDLTGMGIIQANEVLKQMGIDYEYDGEGVVNYQIPSAGAKIKSTTVAYFHLTNE